MLFGKWCAKKVDEVGEKMLTPFMAMIYEVL
jgi:hypothetical protein